MPPDSHVLMDGKLHLYRRPGSTRWQCATYIGGRNHRRSTGQESLSEAKAIAREWYLDREAEERMRTFRAPGPAAMPTTWPVSVPLARPGMPAAPKEKTFKDAAAAFLEEFEIITQGERNPSYVASKGMILKRALLPFFGNLPLSAVTAGAIQEYRVHRLTPPAEKPRGPPVLAMRKNGKLQRVPRRRWKRPSRSTLHKEIVCLRQVLRTAIRKGWLWGLPDMSTPYRASGKVTHRAWFSPEEYKRLYDASRARAKNPTRERWRTQCEHFHDYVVFMVSTGLRPDEAKRLEFRDVSVVNDAATSERILEIEVRGKRGVGYCKSLPAAVAPFRRIRRRKGGLPTDLVFGEIQRELFNAVLSELDLKFDRDGNRRTAYSLRHTYISFRLMEGADIYQVAKNCRTSVEMVEKYYASHIKNVLDAAAINVRKAALARG